MTHGEWSTSVRNVTGPLRLRDGSEGSSERTKRAIDAVFGTHANDSDEDVTGDEYEDENRA